MGKVVDTVGLDWVVARPRSTRWTTCRGRVIDGTMFRGLSPAKTGVKARVDQAGERPQPAEKHTKRHLGTVACLPA